MSIPDGNYHILIVRALQLGDLLCAMPTISALREWKPNAHITLCGLPWAKWLVDRYPELLDDFVEFPGYPGIPEVEFNTHKWNQFQKDVAGRFDLAIQLQGSGTYINDFVRSLGARETAGFYPPEQPGLALDHGCPWPGSGHEIERLKQVALQLGAPNGSNKIELPVRQSEIAEARQLLTEARNAHKAERSGSANRCSANYCSEDRPIICVHAGGRSLTRRWPTEHYQVVVTQLLEQGYCVVLTGTHEEIELAKQLQQGLSQACFNLVGRTTLGQLIGLIDQAQLLLTNDTGVSHIAAARQTPSVVIGLGSDLHRWLPLNRQLHRPVYVDVPCRPCYAAGCPTLFECAQGVTPAMVMQAIDQQLSTARSPKHVPQPIDSPAELLLKPSAAEQGRAPAVSNITLP